MADYIDRKDLENKIFKLINPDFPDVMQTIYSQPSVDAVEVVRCKDCKHSKERETNGKFEYFAKYYCNKNRFCVYDDFFCKCGEK